MQRKMAKNLPTDRHRGGAAFVETRTGAFYGRLGYLAGLGRPAKRIAEELGGRYAPNTSTPRCDGGA
ncbi:hypothetical protein SAMN02983003_0697 [Devosia enhydra]|uniref:Uncharacterized protein n=1 Tax=Devosia enhydra TaxID=665118 RepID=A0A1K2HU07_9HYPH|nr:hypothetical protein [Devosia enhydra]SFZ81797.1 hypothetical protein SAMN02983003_0697 [Devosia enhydra]